MKNGRQATSLCVVAVLLGVAGSASAQGVPQTMTVQGILRDAEGVPIEESTTFLFELVDGTTVVWMEEHAVIPRAGLFTLTLGRDEPIDAALFVDRLSLRVTVADEAMDPIALTSVPYAFRADTAEHYDGDVSWGQLTDLPEGFTDGTDDGNTYAAGTGLTLADDTFAVDAAVVQSRVSGTCAAGQSIRAIAQDGTVTCEIDDVGPPGTTYTAGLGLTLTGTQFDVDPAVMQARVTATCPAGQSIRAIAAGGTVTCEPDDDTIYAAGTGLTLTGTTFAMDPALVQARVSSSCAAGSAIRAIAADGTVTCEVPAAGASYSAGAGLTLTGTTFAVDPAVVQARVASTCPAGSSIRAIAADGAVMCEIDDDTDTTYAAGAGLTLSGTTFAVDPTAIQARVTGTCPAGQAIRGVNTDGTVTCGGSTGAALNLPTSGRASCQAILTAGESLGDGVYWIDPTGGPTADAFLARCDMTTESGGWTLVMNVEPADGSSVSFTNTAFWMAEAEYGQIGNHFTHDYKSPAAWLVPGTNIMVQVANPGLEGNVIGYRAWSMPARSFDVFFDAGVNTTQTTAVIGSDVADVYLYEPLIRNGMQLVSNRQINPNNDRVRLGASGYPRQGDDNQPGLGTQMNEAICGVGVNCYRFRDVELWVDSASNLWCTVATTPGTHGWIGTDGGCGASCGSPSCDATKGFGYSPYWTYRISVR